MSALPKERALDLALRDALQHDKQFLAWFVNRLKHGASFPRFHWSRSDDPWDKTKVLVPNNETGALEAVWSEGETNVLLVLEALSKKRLGVHIQNKRVSGTFTPFQPEVCAARAEELIGNDRFENYQQWETVLLAPNSFYQMNVAQARKFTTFIPHEDLSRWLPLFSPGFQAEECHTNDDRSSVVLSVPRVSPASA